MNKEFVLYDGSRGRVWFDVQGRLCGDELPLASESPLSGGPDGYALAMALGKHWLRGGPDENLFRAVAPRYRFARALILGDVPVPSSDRLVFWNTGLRLTTIEYGAAGNMIEKPAPALKHAHEGDGGRAPFYVLPKKYLDERCVRIAWLASEELETVNLRPNPDDEYSTIVELVCKRPQWELALHMFFWIVEPDIDITLDFR